MWVWVSVFGEVIGVRCQVTRPNKKTMVNERTLGRPRAEHEADLRDEAEGEAEAGDDGADAVDEPLGGGVVDGLEQHYEPEDEA